MPDAQSSGWMRRRWSAVLVIPVVLSCQMGGRCARPEGSTPPTDGTVTQGTDTPPADVGAVGSPEDDPTNLIGRRPRYMGLSVEGVWGTAPDNVWAVTAGRSNGMVVRWNGVSWSHVPNTAGTMDEYRAIWGSGEDDVWFVGSNRSTHGDPISHWNGRDLAPASSGIEPSLYSVWGSAADDVWAVGHEGAMAHWNGRTWSAVACPVEGDLAAVWGSAPDSFFAVGCEGHLDDAECRAGFVLRFDGHTWSVLRRGPETRYDLIWGSGPDDLWIVGHHFIPGQGNLIKVLRWNGSAWTYLDIPPEGEMTTVTGIGGSGPRDVWIGGYFSMPDRSERNFVFRFDGQGFRRVPSAESTYPRAFWPNGPGDIWIGSYESVARWTDGTWTSDVAVGVEDTGSSWLPVLHQDVPPVVER